MNIWIFLSTHSGIPYELTFLTLSLLFYYRREILKRRHLFSIFQKIAIPVIAFGLFRLLGEFLKNGLAFPRPCWSPAHPSLIPCPASFSLPSGHVLGAFMLAVFISLVFQIRLISLISLTLALLVSLSRYFTGIHTVLDITVGGTLGIVFGFLLWKFYWITNKTKKT